MTCSVTNSSTILFVHGKCHVRKQKSCITGLAGYYICLSRELLLIPLEWGHTHRHTHQLPQLKKFQEIWHILACDWHATYLKIV